MDDTEREIIKLSIEVQSLKDMVHKANNNATPGFATIAAQVTGLDKQVTKLDTSIEKLSQKLDEKSKIPWGHLIGMAGIVLSAVSGVGGFLVSGINQDITRLEKDISETKTLIVPRAEHDSRWRQADVNREGILKGLDKLESRPGR